MSAKEDRLQLQTSRPTKFRIEYLERITEQFSPRLIIGRGGFGTVYKGKKDDGEFIAVKVLNQTEIAQIDDTKFKKEVLNVMHICHPNIVRLEGYCISKDEELITHEGTHLFAENRYKMICFEFLPNGSLDAYLNNEDKCREPNWNECYNIIKGICQGLHYLHEGRGDGYILHLDLKPANVLLDKNMMPKIADFGQSRLRLLNEGQTHTTKLVCTRAYMPPEYIAHGVLSKKTDIYSLGVIIMEIIAGKRKYPDEQLDEVVRGKWKETLSASGSQKEYEQIENCILLALRCMEKEPEKRPDGMKEVIEILGISEDGMNHHPDGIEQSEVDPLLEQHQHGLLQRRNTMTEEDQEMSPLKFLQSSTTAVTTATTQLWETMNLAIVPGTPENLGLLVLILGVLVCLVDFLVKVYIVPSYEMWQTVFITVAEASFTRVDVATAFTGVDMATASSPVEGSTYNISAMTMDIYSPTTMEYAPKVTKPMEAAFFFGGQRLDVVPLLGEGEYLQTMSVDPGSRIALYAAAVVAEYSWTETSKSWLLEVEVVVVGQVMYSSSLGTFTMCRAAVCICTVQATCPFKLQRVALLEETAAVISKGGFLHTVTLRLELFQKVKCPLHRICSSYQ